MFDIPPGPTALELGPLVIGWYGLGYAIGLAAAYLLMVRLARIAGEDPEVVQNGIIIVSIAALIGGWASTVASRPGSWRPGGTRDGGECRSPAGRTSSRPHCS